MNNIETVELSKELYTKQKVGLITNYFSEQLINRDYNGIALAQKDYQEFIEIEDIGIVFVDNEIYEVDHVWYGEDLSPFMNYAKTIGLKIIIIKNTSKVLLADYRKLQTWRIAHDSIRVIIEENNIVTPPLLNELIFNPINSKSEKDILFLQFFDRHKEEETQQFYNANVDSTEEFFMSCFKRQYIIQLLERIKLSRMIYIHYNKVVDINFLKYIEAAAYLQNTLVIFDERYQEKSLKGDNTLKFLGKNNTPVMKAFVQSPLFTDKHVIPNGRRTFLHNTLIMRGALKGLLNGKYKKNTIGISVITSSKRRDHIENYIEQLNQQKYVVIECILLTHGFTLTQAEKNYYLSLAKFELKFLQGEDKLSLGQCLNKCLNETKYEYVTKVDDDDFYCSNYLIDSWIAAEYSKADMVGKNASFIYLQSHDLIMLRHSKNQYKYVSRVIGGSLFGKASVLKKYKFGNLSKGEDSDLLSRIKEDGGSIYAGHPYETCLFRAKDQSLHTWKVDEVKLLNSSIVMSYGSPRALLSMN